MRYILTERSSGSRRIWTISGPFHDPDKAERAATAALATPTCLSVLVVGIRDMRVIVSQPSPGSGRMDGTDQWSVCKRQLDLVRASVAADYPETAADASPMPDAILADYLADRSDPREQLVR